MATECPTAQAPSSIIDVLPRILGEISTAEFFSTYYGRTPLLRRAAAQWVNPIATEQLCERLVRADQVDFLAVRDGKPFAGKRPQLGEAHELFSTGYTWVMRDAKRGYPGLAEFGRALASEIHGALHLHVYRTPQSHGGFGWHFDPEEVFFFQTAGRKVLRVRENTLHPRPLVDQMPTHLQARSEPTPVDEYVLEPGDWLYVPCGFWHSAEAVEDSISISVGVLAPSYLDALAMVAQELARDPRWRQRLCPMGRASPLSEEERQRAW